MNNPYDEVDAIRAMARTVAAASDTQSIHDGYEFLEEKQRALASEPWPESVKRLTATDPGLLIIKEHLEDALRQLEQCTYYDPQWTYAQSKPAGRTWRDVAVDVALIAGTLVSLSVSTWLVCHWN